MDGIPFSNRLHLQSVRILGVRFSQNQEFKKLLLLYCQTFSLKFLFKAIGCVPVNFFTEVVKSLQNGDTISSETKPYQP